MSHIVFYKTFGGDPYVNMAFDEWLLRQALATPGAAYLRLYTWCVPTITFGYNQRQTTALDWGRVGDTPVIRRITGGRALYHDLSEYTYAIAANTGDPAVAGLGGSVAKTSETISVALGAFLNRMGVTTSRVRQTSARDTHPDVFHKAPCFTSAARYELMAGGRKIVASAQKRLRGALLQHGSIKLSGVAAHPALDGVGAGNRLKPLDIKDFDVTAGVFAEAMGVALELSFTPAASSPSARTLAPATESVKKNALQRRVIVERSHRTVSL